ncbi:hypothetical protein L6164_025653 [Bauhinia variegata]|uniref:Uncharacterized protein n=1 Tax=Bauhinia variegata TaxID=167791 RepID=A0ACB9M1C1_BAUVA|nr:hypothetical protein L6164_025653 [Bauhinia variegata]
MKGVLAVWIIATAFQYSIAAYADLGITYGTNGDNFPSPVRVSEFLEKDMKHKIPIVRFLNADVEILQAFSDTNLGVTISVTNAEIPTVATSQEAANAWVHDHITPFAANSRVRFRYITVGIEAIPGDLAPLVTPAMTNIYQALILVKSKDFIKVTTVVSPTVLGQSYPPSTGQFEQSVSGVMDNVTRFLQNIGSPLLLNIYPYYALVNEPDKISMQYALFQSKEPVVIDGEYKYYNLFDAMVDAFVAATEKVVGNGGLRVVVSETGWPTKGNEPYTNVKNAQIYNSNLRHHVITVGRTPRQGDYKMEVYIYSMFNEDKKPDPVGASFGTFNDDLTEVYPIWH